MFEYNKELELYAVDLGNAIITCNEVSDGFEELAKTVAENYTKKLDDVVEFLSCEGISDYFGDLTPDKIKEGLGVPLIDIGSQTVTYTDHTLDKAHIIEFEYEDSEFGDFSMLAIDG